MPRIVDREQKRRSILQAAMRAFARKGVIGTKASDIASEAGVGKGTIYEYFRSKEEIFAAAFELFFENVHHNIEQALKKTDDPVAKLRIIVEESLNGFLQEDGKFAELIMEFWAAGVREKDPDVLSAIDLKGLYAVYRKFFAEIIDEGIRKEVFRPVDTFLTASLILAVLDGIGLQWIMDRDQFDTRRITDQTFEILLEGVRRK